MSDYGAQFSLTFTKADGSGNGLCADEVSAAQEPGSASLREASHNSFLPPSQDAVQKEVLKWLMSKA